MANRNPKRKRGISVGSSPSLALFEVALFNTFGILLYAEGVVLQSPGSRRSRAPWVQSVGKTSTPKALHNVLARVTPRIV